MRPPPGYTLGPVIGGRAGATLVFAAQRPDGPPCALKTIDRAVILPPWRLARFERECELHAAATRVTGVAPARVVSGPPGSPSLATSAQDAERTNLADAWLDIEWAHGGDLAAASERASPPATASSLDVAHDPHTVIASLARTVAALHDHGIVHRDIKPSNILIDAGALWLTDFGVAAQHGTSLPPPFRELSAGTPEWSAPELLASPPAIDPASDVYALGRVWQWLQTRSHVPRDHRASRLIREMLQDNPRDRPSSRDVAAALSDAAPS